MAQLELRQTKWNASQLSAERLDGILRELIRIVTERYVTENVIGNWRQNIAYLNRLYTEIRAKMDHKLQYNNDNILWALQSNCDEAVKLFKQGKLVPASFVNDLDKWEFVLRDYAERKGILMPDQRDVLDSIGES